MTHIKKIIFLLSLVVLISPVFAHAENIFTQNTLGSCVCTEADSGGLLPPVIMSKDECTKREQDPTISICNWQESKGAPSASTEAVDGCPPDSICLENPLGTNTNIPVAFGNAIKVVTGIMGSLALVVFVYGGFMWVMAGGNSERIQKGTQAMIWAVIGIVVVFSSYAIITLVLNALGAT
jgi:hypothetical protein